MKKLAAAIVLGIALIGSAAAVQAKSKIWDLIFQEEGIPGAAQTPQTGQVYTVEIKMANGETFRVESNDPAFDDVEFTGAMKLDQPDGTYYLNSGQVQYIRVTAK